MIEPSSGIDITAAGVGLVGDSAIATSERT
jgi:hypothetical protein